MKAETLWNSEKTCRPADGRLLPVLLAILFVCLSVSRSLARADWDYVGQAYHKYVAETDRETIQYLLNWNRLYSGAIDGEFGPNTLFALRQFQKSAGVTPNGILDARQIDKLASSARRAADKVSYKWTPDARARVVLSLPSGLDFKVSPVERGTRYDHNNGQLHVSTAAQSSAQVDFLEFYRKKLNAVPRDKVVQNSFRGDYFILAWDGDNRRHLARYREVDSDIRGMHISYSTAVQDKFRYLAEAMIWDFQPQIGALPKDIIRRPSFKGFPKNVVAALRGKRRPSFSRSFGTGFLVSNRGHVLTNAHVVDDCTSIKVDDFGGVDLVSADTENDLALLHVRQLRGRKPSRFADKRVRLGETVAAFGFPLRAILADQLNMTTGTVSSLAGMGGDQRFIQISAPVQRGNSGGPLLDSSGRVVGIVTSKLDALSIARKSGGLPQAVNFAVRRGVAIKFLERHGVTLSRAPAGVPLSGPDLADQALSFTLRVACGK